MDRVELDGAKLDAVTADKIERLLELCLRSRGINLTANYVRQLYRESRPGHTHPMTDPQSMRADDMLTDIEQGLGGDDTVYY